MQVARRRCLNAFRSLSTTTNAKPWFIDSNSPDEIEPRPSPLSPTPPLPSDTPETLRKLHSELALIPHLDHSQLVVSRSLMFTPGPPLPFREPQGRRKRGGTYAGESMFDMPGGIWNWIVLAQVGLNIFLLITN